MYERRSRLSRYKQYEWIKMFVAGVTGRAASEIVEVHRNTAAKFLHEERSRWHGLVVGSALGIILSIPALNDIDYLAAAGIF